MKILCVCTGGNSRSGTMANILRRLGHDALNASSKGNSRATIDALCGWADRIFTLSDEAEAAVPVGIRVDVGDDIWGQTMAPPLVVRCLEGIEQNWKLLR
jgi:hypothetical protein